MSSSTPLSPPAPTSAHGAIADNSLTEISVHIKRLVDQQQDMIKQYGMIANEQKETAQRQIQLLEKLSNNAQTIPHISSYSTKNGWTPTLSKIARKNSIKPDVDQWKETLDNLLIFVALFSAIVTAFLVPALAGLSQDPAERTNELVSNLTEIIIQLSQVDATSLNLSISTPFKPTPGAIRQVVFWSLSLLTSVSIASLAIIQRTYPASIARVSSQTSQARYKLIVMLVRWKQSTRILKPVVDALPHILILAVVLFIAGLLNTIFSSAAAISPVPKPVFTAGIISSIIVGFCGATIIHTIFFGLAPVRIPLLHQEHAWATVRGLCPVASDVPEDSSESESPDDQSQPAQSMVLEAYHTVLLNTYDQNDAVQVAEALWGIVEPTMKEASDGGKGKYAQKVTDLIVYLLLPDYGQMANLTCALSIAKIYQYINKNAPHDLDQHPLLGQSQTSRIIQELNTAIERYRQELSPSEAPEKMWACAYMQALASIYVRDSSEENYRDAPSMLLLSSEPVPGGEKDLRGAQALAATSLYHALRLDDSLRLPGPTDPIDTLLQPLGDIHGRKIFDSRKNMSALIDFWEIHNRDDDQQSKVNTALAELSQWLCRRGFAVFVEEAMFRAKKWNRILPLLLQAVVLFRLRDTDTNPSFYAEVISQAISLVERFITESKAIPSGLRDSIVAIIRNMAAGMKEKATWARKALDKKILADVPVANAIRKDMPKAEADFANAKTRLEQLTVPDSNAQRGHLQEDVHAVNEEARIAILAAFPATPVPATPPLAGPPPAPAPATPAPAALMPAEPAPEAPLPAGPSLVPVAPAQQINGPEEDHTHLEQIPSHASGTGDSSREEGAIET